MVTFVYEPIAIESLSGKTFDQCRKLAQFYHNIGLPGDVRIIEHYMETTWPSYYAYQKMFGLY